MFFRRIKALLKTKHEGLFIAFELAHFLIDLLLVVHLYLPHSSTLV
jgi:hypothetical protein